MGEIWLRRCLIPSPFFFAPINTGLATSGSPDDRLIRFHAERSGKGIGVSYVGNVAVAAEFRSNSGTLFFGESLSKWKELASIMYRNGSVPGVQLACRLPGPPPSKKWRNAQRDDLVARWRRMICDLDSQEIEKIADHFVSVALKAVEAGFDIIQIHAAHGYFLSQMMSRRINPRNDRFHCHSLEPLSSIIARIRSAAPSAVLDVRVSVYDGLENKNDENYRITQTETIANLDVDIISVSAGHYEVDRFMTYPAIKDGHAVYLAAVLELAKRFNNRVWNVAGNIWNLDALQTTHRPNLTYSIGRPLIADPAFVEKALSGRVVEIRHCVRAGHCHYYTRGQPHIGCKVNPGVGR